VTAGDEAPLRSQERLYALAALMGSLEALGADPARDGLQSRGDGHGRLVGPALESRERAFWAVRSR